MPLPLNKLIHISQIDGLEDLQNIINQIYNAYSSDHVVTPFLKYPNTNEYYSLSEYLQILKTQIEGIAGKIMKDKIKLTGIIETPGTKTISDEVLQVLVERQEFNTYHFPVINGSQTLKCNGVDLDINEYDFDYNIGKFVLGGPSYGTFSATYQYVVTTPQLYFNPSIPASLFNLIDTTKNYPLYYDDNIPVQDASGNNVTYNFTTKLLSGIPSTRDTADHNVADGITYLPLTTDKSFKIFPIYTSIFTQLPDEFLLDNEELNTITYQKIIDDIYTRLNSVSGSTGGGQSGGGSGTGGGQPVGNYAVYKAGEQILKHDPVALVGNLVYRGDNRLENHAGIIAGFAGNDALTGADVYVFYAGEYVNPSWNWSISLPVQPIFLGNGTDGMCSQNVPVNPPAAFSQIIAQPITATKVLIKMYDAIILLPEE